MTQREINILRAAGYSFTVGQNEVFMIREGFDFDNPGSHIDYESIIKETEYHLNFVEKIKMKISNKSFMDKAPAHVIEIEYKKINDSMTIVRRNCEILDYIFNITSERNKKSELKELTKQSNKLNDKQKELIISEIENSDEHFINILEEKLKNGIL